MPTFQGTRHTPRSRILWAEDSSCDRALISYALRELGTTCEVKFVSNPSEALALLFPSERSEAPPFDLVVSDLHLHLGSGFELLQAIRANRDLSQLPVALFTTSSAQDDIEQALLLDASAYFIKPAMLSEFLATVMTIITRGGTGVLVPFVLSSYRPVAGNSAEEPPSP